jgi:MFS family permease
MSLPAKLRPPRSLVAALPRLARPRRAEASTGVEAVAPYAWATVILLSLANFSSFFDRIILTFMFVPLQRDLHLSDTQLGILAGPAFALTYLVTSLPLGYCADRLSRRWMVIAALCVWSLMTLGCGLASSFVLLVLFRAGVGIGEAVLHPCASSVIGDMFGQRHRPIAFGIFFTSGASAIIVSFLLGGLITGWLSHFAVADIPVLGTIATWRATLVASCALGLILVPFMVVLLREPRRSPVERRQDGTGSETLGRFLKGNWLLVLAITAGIPIGNAGVYTFLSWITVFFDRVHHWPASRAGVVFALTCGAAALIGSVSSGLLPQALARRGVRAPVLPACLSIVVLVNGFGAAAMLASNPVVAVALLTIAFFGMMSASVFAFSMISEVVPAQFRGTFTALTIVGTALLTGGMGPLLAGVLTQHVFKGTAGIGSALCVIWLVALVIGGGILALARRRYHDLAEATAAKREQLQVSEAA